MAGSSLRGAPRHSGALIAVDEHSHKATNRSLLCPFTVLGTPDGQGVSLGLLLALRAGLQKLEADDYLKLPDVEPSCSAQM